MGTELLRLGWSPSEHGPSHLWNRTHPNLVRAVHSQWADAGAQIHRANTFTLLPALAFGSPTEQAEAWELTARGIELAREAAPGGIVVVALGPVAPNAYPPHKTVSPQMTEVLSRADGILLETWSHPHVVDWAKWIRPDRQIPLILSGCFRPRAEGTPQPGNLAQVVGTGLPEGDVVPASRGDREQDFGPIFMETLGGQSPGDWVGWAERAGAEAVGFNCGWDWTPEMAEGLVERFARIWPGPLWCYPGPILRRGQKCSNWERSIWGGCCGVSLENLAKIHGLPSLECSTKRL